MPSRYINMDIERLRGLRQLTEQMQSTWTSPLEQMERMPTWEVREIERDGNVFRGEDVQRSVLKDIKITDIPRKEVKESGIAQFCKKNYK